MINKSPRYHIKRFALLFIPLVFSSFFPDESVTSNGNVTFTVKTVTYNGERSPKNIVAIWIEDSAGKFIKTRLLQADRRKQWLLTWNEKSGGSTVDAVTGATLSSHQSHTITWDCTDESGTPVGDGDYKVVVEFTEEHAQGPMTSVSFTKGPVSQSINPDNQTNFVDMALEYTVDATGIPGVSSWERELLVSPNPFAGQTTVRFRASEAGPVGVRVYGLNGKLLREMDCFAGSAGYQSIQWDGRDDSGEQLPDGVYLLRIQMKNRVLGGRVLKLRQE